MKQELNPIYLIIGALLALAVVIVIFVRATGPAEPPANSYTPGVPPWLEKNKTGGQPGAQAGQQGVRQVPSNPAAR